MLNQDDAKVLYKARHMTMVERDAWEFVIRNGITGIIVIVPVTDDRRLVLVEQHRIPVKANVIELPAGLVGDDGDPDEKLSAAAQRELLEETGYEARCWQFLTEGPPSPGMSDEIVSFFLATGLRRVGKGGGVEGENITVHEVPLGELHDWLREQQRDGKMVDPKLFTGVYFAQRHVDSNPGQLCDEAERLDG